MDFTFHVIIPTRGDRPEFLDHAINQLNRNIEHLQAFCNIEPSRHIALSAPGETKVDLVEKIEAAIQYHQLNSVTTGFFSSLAGKRQQKKTVYVIWEDDDCYPDHYLTAIALKFANNPKLQAFGYCQTLYMHLSERKQRLMVHPERASLFQTAFTAEAVKDFNWKALYGKTNLDMELWRHIKANFIAHELINSYQAIGIKHNIGLCGGLGHKASFYNSTQSTDLDHYLIPHYHQDFYIFIQSKTEISVKHESDL